jgi:hypothetical protein
MKQMTLAAAGFERYAKTTRRAVFLAEMERVVPWPALYGLIEPFYPKAGNGRPPITTAANASFVSVNAAVTSLSSSPAAMCPLPTTNASAPFGPA